MCLNSDELEIRNENTIYHAARRWWRMSRYSAGSQLPACASPLPSCTNSGFNSSSSKNNHVCVPLHASVCIPVSSSSLSGPQIASLPFMSISTIGSAPSTSGTTNESQLVSTVLALFQCIRWPHLSSDFLLDVVKFDNSWYSTTHRTIRRALHTATREAAEFHASSAKRRMVHPRMAKLMFQRRPSCMKSIGSGPAPFTWRIEQISKMVEGRYVLSPSFYLDGYWFRYVFISILLTLM